MNVLYKTSTILLVEAGVIAKVQMLPQLVLVYLLMIHLQEFLIVVVVVALVVAVALAAMVEVEDEVVEVEDEVVVANNLMG
jgi:hypothetical protein